MTDSSPLIVPIEVQAMVLNDPNATFKRAAMNYRRLEYFQSPSPGAFEPDPDNFANHTDQAGLHDNHGVYLRWVLPAALRHGKTNDRHEIEFPAVPDRWLVVRLFRPDGAGSAEPACKAWVVQSNHGPDGTSAFLDPATAKRIHIGRKVELSAGTPWTEPGGAKGLVLRAVAEGNPAFATYQPFNEDVFSIHDDLTTQKVSAGTLSYFVIGWYSNPANDILANWQPGDDGEGFAKWLDELKWSASRAGAAARTSIYQGMVFSVPWTPWAPGVQPPPSPKDGLKPQVAFGNTSVDGVVAFAKAALEEHPLDGLSPQQAADLLEAFEYDMLPMLREYGAEDMLEQQIRSRAFGSAHAGTRFTLVNAESPPGKPTPTPISVDDEEQAREAERLATLNAEQSDLDVGLRELMGAQRRLFELWWKTGLVESLAEDGEAMPWGIDSIEQLQAALADLTGEAQRLAAKCADLASKVEEARKALALPSTRVLKQVAAPRFWAPADPVVVVSNTAHTMKLEPDSELPCRWPAELPAPANAPFEPVIPWTGLPAWARALVVECCALERANTSAWTQPWQPLYLDWEIDWYSIPLPNWSFNGHDYESVPGAPMPEHRSLLGRTVLTPKPSFELKARLDQFLADNKGTEAAQQLVAVEGLIEAVDQWDFLSQALSGLGTLLSGWRPDPTQNPDPNHVLAALIGDVSSGAPDPKLYEEPEHAGPSSFEGMRGGQLHLNRMAVVDAFGQTLWIVTIDTRDQFRPLVADSLVPANPINPAIERARLVELPPRLLQPARLNFQFDGGTRDSPILGWILPNHIDSGLAIYAADGKPHGELMRPANPAAKPDWVPAPGSRYTTLAQLAAAEPELGGLALSLQTGGTQTFSDFLTTVDETLWTVDVTGNSNDTFLATLVGRPLAVVGAKLSLELQTSPWADPEWPFTFAQTQSRLLDYEFPVRLGDLGYRQDGLIGYFVDGDHSQFHTVHVPEGSSQSNYLVPIAPDKYLNLRFAARGPGAPAVLTLIMDPRAGVHAQCGLFPVKQLTLVPQWVDDALASMAVTFRTGPVLARTEPRRANGQAEPEMALLLPIPAERRGHWSWLERDGDGNWAKSPLAPVSDAAVFPDTPPVLHEGLLELEDSLDK